MGHRKYRVAYMPWQTIHREGAGFALDLAFASSRRDDYSSHVSTSSYDRTDFDEIMFGIHDATPLCKVCRASHIRLAAALLALDGTKHHRHLKRTRRKKTERAPPAVWKIKTVSSNHFAHLLRPARVPGKTKSPPSRQTTDNTNFQSRRHLEPDFHPVQVRRLFIPPARHPLRFLPWRTPPCSLKREAKKRPADILAPHRQPAHFVGN